MALQLKQKFSEKFEADIRFFKGWLDGPKTVGTPFATSVHTGRAMAGVIDPASGLPVLEVGPGTGTITSEILARGVSPESLYAVEYSEDFAMGLRAAFPGVNIIQGDVFALDALLGAARAHCFRLRHFGHPAAEFSAGAPRRLCRRHAEPHPNWPPCHSGDLQPRLARPAALRQFLGGAGGLYPPKRPARASVDIPAGGG